MRGEIQLTMEKKRVAFLLFDITQRAGTERAVTNLANSLAATEEYIIEILSALSHPGDIPAYPLEPGVSVRHLAIKKTNHTLKRYGQFVKACRAYIRIDRLDLIIGTTHALNCLLLFMGVGRKVKLIAWEHMSYMACPFLSRIVRRGIYPFLDKVVLLTNADAKHYRFVRAKNRCVIPNVSLFRPDSQKQLSSRQIIAIGRLTKQKGFDLLVQVVDSIREELDGWVVDIYGDGEDREELEKEIERLHLTNKICIHPPVKDVQLLYQKASVYLMTSRWEGLPMVLIEAESCGLPIVSFDCPEGPRDIVTDGKNGFLVTNGDLKAMGDAIKRITASENLRHEMSKEALEDSKRFSPSSIVMQWERYVF